MSGDLGGKRGSKFAAHLIVEHEEVVIKRQGDSAPPHTLVEGLVPDAVYDLVTVERTLMIALMNERSARVVSRSS